jgi:hypothetical protein
VSDEKREARKRLLLAARRFKKAKREFDAAHDELFLASEQFDRWR